MADKHFINLLQPELIPEQPLLSLQRVVVLWGGVFVAMMFWAVTNYFQLEQLEQQAKQLTQVQSQQAILFSELERKIRKNKADPILVERLITLKSLMENKRLLHAQLTDLSSAHVAGFARAMTELSQMHHRDIQLESVHIDLHDMTFTGLSKKPEAVPQWLAGFEHSTLLSGKSFINFKLTENEQHLTQFVVSSKSGAALKSEMRK